MLETVAKELAQARDRLIDLTLRNRLTNFRPTRRTSIRIVHEIPAEVWRLLVSEERTVSFLAREEHELLKGQERYSDSQEDEGRPEAAGAENDEEAPTFELPPAATALEGEGPLAGRYTDRFLQTDLTTRGLQVSLLRTAHYAQSALDETGVNVLFLAFGMLHWRRSDQPERVLQAPLVLVPVALQRVSAGNRFTVRILGDDPVLNPCMDAVLQQDLRVTMPTAPDDWSGFDIERFFGETRQRVATLPDWHVEPDICVANGNLWSLLAVGGGMQNVWVDVNGTGPSAGRLSSAYVGGNATGSRFEVERLLSSLVAQGNFANSSVQAGSLSVVYVGGALSEDGTDGDTDEIHADEGRSFARDETWAGWVDRDHDHWFDDVRARVG